MRTVCTSSPATRAARVVPSLLSRPVSVAKSAAERGRVKCVDERSERGGCFHVLSGLKDFMCIMSTIDRM